MLTFQFINKSYKPFLITCYKILHRARSGSERRIRIRIKMVWIRNTAKDAENL
jgi:hypothetical protein